MRSKPRKHVVSASTYDLRFPLARSMIVSGPSCSGKSFFIAKLLKHASLYFNPPPKKIYWFYGEVKPKPILPRVTYKQGVPTSEDVESFQDCVVVLDDLMLESRSNKDVGNLFTRVAHHRRCFVIHITQNLFTTGSITRTQSLNAHYFVLFKNPRDRLQITYLARQMYPKNSDFLTSAFEDATEEKHRYLLLDLEPSRQEFLRVRSNILIEDKQYTVYMPANHVYETSSSDSQSLE